MWNLCICGGGVVIFFVCIFFPNIFSVFGKFLDIIIRDLAPNSSRREVGALLIKDNKRAEGLCGCFN